MDQVSTIRAVEDTPQSIPNVRIRDVDAEDGFGKGGRAGAATDGMVEVCAHFTPRPPLSLLPYLLSPILTRGNRL